MAAGSFQDSQVSYDLSEAFPKTNAPEVNSQGSGVKEPCKVKDREGTPGEEAQTRDPPTCMAYNDQVTLALSLLSSRLSLKSTRMPGGGGTRL